MSDANMRNFFALPNEVFELMLTPSELAVLCYLVRCADVSGSCFPSIHTIACACRISDNTVRKAVRNLAERKIIKKAGGFGMSKFGKAQTSSYVFSINSELFSRGFCRNNLLDFISRNSEGSIFNQ